jgi:hypothetical protein
MHTTHDGDVRVLGHIHARALRTVAGIAVVFLLIPAPERVVMLICSSCGVMHICTCQVEQLDGCATTNFRQMLSQVRLVLCPGVAAVATRCRGGKRTCRCHPLPGTHPGLASRTGRRRWLGMSQPRTAQTSIAFVTRLYTPAAGCNQPSRWCQRELLRATGCVALRRDSR